MRSQVHVHIIIRVYDSERRRAVTIRIIHIFVRFSRIFFMILINLLNSRANYLFHSPNTSTLEITCPNIHYCLRVSRVDLNGRRILRSRLLSTANWMCRKWNLSAPVFINKTSLRRPARATNVSGDKPEQRGWGEGAGGTRTHLQSSEISKVQIEL